jgi:hypothetical protein
MDLKAGGVSQAIFNIIAGLSELGVENEVISLDATADTSSGVVIHALGPAKGPWSFSKKLMPWLAENLYSFDIVIVHGMWLYHGYAVSKIIKQIKKDRKISDTPTGSISQRFFIMPHGMLDPYFQKAKGRKLKA